MLRPLAVPFILLLHMLDAHAEQPQFEDRVGDAYEIRLESASQTSLKGRSSGRSSSKQAMMERVIALHDGGIELEFDLPEQASQQDRARTWQLPVRVLKSPGRPLQLLNRPELETRVRAWLQTAKIPQSACGRWIFTWTAVKIECDPNSVLNTIEHFDLRLGEFGEGTLHNESGARGPAALRREAFDSNGATYAAELEIDPDVMRRQRAEADVAVAEMTRKAPLTLEAALQARQGNRISGTIVTTFEMDSAGRLTRRRRVTQVGIADQAGSLERETTTETVERRLVSRHEQRP